MDIEASAREEIVSHLGNDFDCIEECRLNLVGFDEALRADVVAFSRSEVDPWILAFEVKVPSGKWELKHWLNALRQTGNYPNCHVVDERAHLTHGCLINASFIYPEPNMRPWDDQASQNTRFYRSHDIDPLRGAILLAQHFKVGTANYDSNRNKFSLKLGADPIWDSKQGFRMKSRSLLARRKIGSTKRSI